MATLKHKTIPFIPKPQKKEEPVHEDLAREDPPMAPQIMKYDVPVLVPNYNNLYDGLRSKQAWNFVADNMVEGSITTTAGTTVTTNVAFTTDPQWQLEQWPNGTQLFLCVRWFASTPTDANFATQGGIRISFLHSSGRSIPLACCKNFDIVNVVHSAIIPAPITDPGELNIGRIAYFLNTGATTGTYLFQIGFSAVYLLPAMKGYNIERVGRDYDPMEKPHHRDF